MTGTDDRDTAVDAHDRWSPGGSPPAPGWYDDPWNPQALRRWDGSAWSGETMRKGPLPDGPAAPARAGGRSLVDPGRRSRRVVDLGQRRWRRWGCRTHPR